MSVEWKYRVRVTVERTENEYVETREVGKPTKKRVASTTERVADFNVDNPHITHALDEMMKLLMAIRITKEMTERGQNST